MVIFGIMVGIENKKTNSKKMNQNTNQNITGPENMVSTPSESMQDNLTKLAQVAKSSGEEPIESGSKNTEVIVQPDLPKTPSISKTDGSVAEPMEKKEAIQIPASIPLPQVNPDETIETGSKKIAPDKELQELYNSGSSFFEMTSKMLEINSAGEVKDI